jgi:predicted nucleotidyltransferase
MDITAAALNENFDAAAASKLYLGAEKPYYDGYAHVAQIVDEEIDSLEDGGTPEISFTKKEYSDSNFDLSSFRPQTDLNPKIWINGKMNSRVRMRLLDIADDFIDTLEVDWAKPKDIILTGSLANYNWSKFSDFDLHIVIDFEEVDDRVNFVKDYFDSKKKLWNEQHGNLKIYGFPVEVYVQDSNEFHNASGVYSLELNEWIRKPEKNGIKAIKLNKYFIKEKVGKYIREIDALYDAAASETDEYELERISEKANALFSKIRSMRREGLKRGGEMDSFNVIFKCLRRTGHIGKLADVKSKTYDKIFSIR